MSDDEINFRAIRPDSRRSWSKSTRYCSDARDKFIAVAFQDLETGTDYFLNADEPLHPASTFKVHVMMEVFRQANEGLLSLEDRLPIVNSFSSIADGSENSF